MKVKIEFFLSGYSSNQDWHDEVRRIIENQIMPELNNVGPGTGQEFSAIYKGQEQIGRITVN